MVLVTVWDGSHGTSNCLGMIIIVLVTVWDDSHGLSNCLG